MSFTLLKTHRKWLSPLGEAEQQKWFYSFFHSFQQYPVTWQSVQISQDRSVSVRDANFFSNRVVDIWKHSPDSTVTTESVSSFKRRLNSFDFSSFISI
jgi:hypothetical protein